ncbi:hypothetical protein [Hymenobacter elongatus]|uniref:Uncharacterized protein n=1 Tax=Hymenobacter elongatus TaxID=877208 RepID=A0A4Z0PJA7_9BACT|nr:hypothetical protein [Hymenobacter elongatus]TGE15588.1 hypothetical protein E5J99_12380 [Hymenobacter elongatus]
MTFVFVWAIGAVSLWGNSPAAPEKTHVQPMPQSVAQPAPSFWQPVGAVQAKRLGRPRLQPRHYRVVRLNVAGLKKALATATSIGATGATGAGLVLLLPLPDGSLVGYRMRPTQVMAPELAAKYPELQTYAGQEIGNTANDVRLELTPAGLRAMLIRNGRTFFIEPYRSADTQHYLCFAKDSLPAGSKKGFETLEK